MHFYNNLFAIKKKIQKIINYVNTIINFRGGEDAINRKKISRGAIKTSIYNVKATGVIKVSRINLSCARGKRKPIKGIISVKLSVN